MVTARACRRRIRIDGSYGEGGGQLLRTAVALAAITGQALSIEHVRAKRTKPGLAPQHLAAVRAVAALCGASVDGLALRSTALTFAPGEMRGGTYDFDVGTAGSITLVLQALLPVLVACSSHSEVTVRGGTDVSKAPPLDYFREVTLPLLAGMGIRAQMTVRRRGYYPRGGGEVTLAVDPSRLRPFDAATPGRVERVRGLAHVAGIDLDIAARMRDACLGELARERSAQTQIEIARLTPELAVGAGGAIVAWAQAENTVLGAGRVAERGIRAETLGSAVGAELRDDLKSGAGVDVHAADQMLIYLALAGEGSLSTRSLSSHAQTAIWLIEQFLPVRFESTSEAARIRVRVSPAAPL
ncbi:MAG TPA: RNA 3'-terminal phosphate cyclase [Casimicrobiaceae bacterium]